MLGFDSSVVSPTPGGVLSPNGAHRDTVYSVVTGRDADMQPAPKDAGDDDGVERFLADLGRIGRQYVARAPEPMRPMRTAEMDQSLTDARMRLGQPLRRRA